MDHHIPWFWKEDHVDPLSWDVWRAGFLPGIRVTKAYIEQYEFIPPGWGVAYRDYMMDCVVVMPIPFNRIWWLVRTIKRWFKIIPPNPEVKAAYEKGYRDGLKVVENRALGIWPKLLSKSD